MTMQQEQNLVHATDPQPGDFWHEMLRGACFVVARAGDMVCACWDTIDHGDRYSFTNPVWSTVEQFRNRLSYKSPKMRGRFFADVAPRNMPVDSYAALIPPVPNSGD